MSVTNAKKFFDAVEKDEKLRTEVRKDFRHMAGVAKKHGFTFTRSEMLEHLKKRLGATKQLKVDGDESDTCCSSF
jgi:predicted ribosomally synthesized peptide with nif11-like leader